SYELVDGRLVEHFMGMKASRIGGRLFGLLMNHCYAHPVGWAFPAETTYQCFPNHPKSVRKPDASFILLNRLPADQEPEGHCRIAPDLAAEVVSPNDTYYEVEQKVREYLEAGVRLVWVINPALRRVRVHRRDGTVTDLGENDELSGEGVVAGFRCR